MSIQIFWPPLAVLALFVGVVIMLLLRFGGRYLRHGPKEPDPDWYGIDAAYEQRVSYA